MEYILDPNQQNQTSQPGLIDTDNLNNPGLI